MTEVRVGIWRYIQHEGAKLENIGITPDGMLHNPNGYPEDVVRAAITAAHDRRHARRSAAAAKAAKTRRSRQEKRVYEVARRVIAGAALGPSGTCEICMRGIDDPESVARGIGSDCWQDILRTITTIREEAGQ